MQPAEVCIHSPKSRRGPGRSALAVRTRRVGLNLGERRAGRVLHQDYLVGARPAGERVDGLLSVGKQIARVGRLRLDGRDRLAAEVDQGALGRPVPDRPGVLAQPLCADGGHAVHEFGHVPDDLVRLVAQLEPARDGHNVHRLALAVELPDGGEDPAVAPGVERIGGKVGNLVEAHAGLRVEQRAQHGGLGARVVRRRAHPSLRPQAGEDEASGVEAAERGWR